MRTLEQQLELGRKLYNVATVHALVAELKEQHDTIIAEKEKRIAELEEKVKAIEATGQEWDGTNKLWVPF